ncbi:MAG TPA: OmpH family outer membrane protein [Candidatus Binataceae bacterium]|nr:OmpH family outer membrane protein [Candidatus Binataceae bacterium]
MRHRLIIGVVTLIALATAATARADMRLAYVDIQRALNDSHNGKTAKAAFRGHLDHVQAQLVGEQAEVQRLKDEIEKKGPLMEPDQRQNLENDYAKKLRDFQDDYKASSDELQEKDKEMTGAIVRDLATVVRQIGEKNGYTMVLEKGSLLWAAPSIDITDQVIRAYDAMNVKPGSLGGAAAGRPGQGGGGQFSSGGPPPNAAPPPAEPSGGDEGRSTISK